MSTLNVVSNFAANVAHRNLSQSSSEATNSVAKLSAGTRVLAAKDDAAALAIGSRLNSEVNSLKQAGVNAGQAISMLQIADGAMSRTNDILVRMKTLAVQSSSGQLSDTERGMLNEEYTALRSEVDRIANDTEFNGTKLLSGSDTFSATLAGTATAIEVGDGFEQVSFTQRHRRLQHRQRGADRLRRHRGPVHRHQPEHQHQLHLRRRCLFAQRGRLP